MNFLLHLRQEWEVISKTPFACLICIVIGFAGGSWYYAEQVATLNSQVAFWKDKATAPGQVDLPSPEESTAPAAKSAHFTMNAKGVNFFTSSDPSLTGIVLDVDIRNSGMASIATGWTLQVAPRGQSPVAAQYVAIPASPPLVVGNPPFTVRAKDSLADKVVKKPIQNDKVSSGRLLFYVRLPLGVVQDQSSRLTLTVQDIAGNVFSTSDLVGDWLRPHGGSIN